MESRDRLLECIKHYYVFSKHVSVKHTHSESFNHLSFTITVSIKRCPVTVYNYYRNSRT